jgi:hypothetical protein
MTALLALLSSALTHLLAGLMLTLLLVSALLPLLTVLALLTTLAVLTVLALLVPTLLTVLALLTLLALLPHLVLAMLTHLSVATGLPSSFSATGGVSSLRLSFALRAALVTTAFSTVAPPTAAIFSCHNQVPVRFHHWILLMCTGRSLTEIVASVRKKPIRSALF